MSTLQNILTDHFTRYPLLEVQDLYKLLHQAALGSGHAFQGEDSARKWLEEELAAMDEGPEEPLLDPISPAGVISRLHLRPSVVLGVEPKAILAAFIHTANDWKGSTQVLSEYGQASASQAERETWRIHPIEITTFFATMEQKGFPVVHHSSAYAGHYRPAYRVIKTAYWRQHESLHLSP